MGDKEVRPAYPSMDIIVLGFLIKLTIWFLSVNHAASHGNGGSFDVVDELWLACVAHSIQATL